MQKGGKLSYLRRKDYKNTMLYIKTSVFLKKGNHMTSQFLSVATENMRFKNYAQKP